MDEAPNVSTPIAPEEEQFLIVIQAVKPEVRELLGEEEGIRVNRSLGQYLRWARSPEHRERALQQAMAKLEANPATKVRVGSLRAGLGVPDVPTLIFKCPVEAASIAARASIPVSAGNALPIMSNWFLSKRRKTLRSINHG